MEETVIIQRRVDEILKEYNIPKRPIEFVERYRAFHLPNEEPIEQEWEVWRNGTGFTDFENETQVYEHVEELIGNLNSIFGRTYSLDFKVIDNPRAEGFRVFTTLRLYNGQHETIKFV